MQKEFFVNSKKRIELIDVLQQVQEIVSEKKVEAGLCNVFVPHTTAGITVQENADPTVQQDLLEMLNELVPGGKNYKHTEGNADSHIKSSIIGCSVAIPIRDGKLYLGTWQGCYLGEFDGPRKRRVIVTIIKD